MTLSGSCSEIRQTLSINVPQSIRGNDFVSAGHFSTYSGVTVFLGRVIEHEMMKQFYGVELSERINALLFY